MNIKQAFLERTADIRTSNSFKFYVPSLVIDPRCSKQESDLYCRAPPPPLLPGELIVTEAHKVLLFSYATDKSKGAQGNLFITNFRVFLVPTDNSEETEPARQRNLLIGEYGVSLSNIDNLQVVGSKGRRLLTQTNVIGRVKALQLVCKNFRVLTFDFEQSPQDHGSNIAKTLLHHAYPNRQALLFAFEFSEPLSEDDAAPGVIMFLESKEWENEIERTCLQKSGIWRVTTVNRKFALSRNLPRFLVVPKTMVDSELSNMSNSFMSSRLPTWSWSHRNGAALIRMADCLPTITVRTYENKFLEFLRGLHENKVAPEVLELDKSLPSVRDIQASYLKLREICASESKRQFDAQDSRFHYLVDNSKWLYYVASCIKESILAAEKLSNGIFVVLQEADGRDTSALVASLVQLILDAHCRTIHGFQSLIQKEWVAMGHPFCSRFGLIRDSGSEQSPVFLLFLDCVWQLQRQCPTFFQFSETYLTSLFDSCFISVFDTFIFNSEMERFEAARQEHEKLKLRSVWNWRRQYSDEDIQLFFNPLYQLDDYLEPRSPKKSQCRLTVSSNASSMNLWAQCYFRWLPQTRIRNGGHTHIDLIHRHLRQAIDETLVSLEEITKQPEFDILRSINNTEDKTVGCSNGVVWKNEKLLDELESVDTYHPFSFSVHDNVSISYLEVSVLSEDAQSSLNLTE